MMLKIIRLTQKPLDILCFGLAGFLLVVLALT